MAPEFRAKFRRARDHAFLPAYLSRKISPEKHFDGHAVSGKPADCVKFAVSVLLKGKKPDLVISGINFGGNDGCSVFYSGTVAGAREGALMGINSFAVSLDCFDNPDFSASRQIHGQNRQMGL